MDLRVVGPAWPEEQDELLTMARILETGLRVERLLRKAPAAPRPLTRG
jgi:hypothetical protein